MHIISQLLGRPVHNLEDFNWPSPRYFRPKFSCTKPCQRNPSFRCATRHSHSLYEKLMYHLQKMLHAQSKRHVIQLHLFQLYKATRICHLHSFHDGITTKCYKQRGFHLQRSSLRSQPRTATSRFLTECRKIKIRVSRLLTGAWLSTIGRVWED